MFKLLYTNLAGPLGDINVSASLVAEAGMIGQIAANASTGDPEVILYASGCAATNKLIGLIDDQKTSSFSATVVNEAVASGATYLAHSNIIAASDSAVLDSTGATVTLTSRVNGTIVATTGTASVSYSYVIPGKAGDDTTLASGKCTIWLQEGEYATDVFELGGAATLSSYAVGAPLYVADAAYGQAGRLTSRSVDGVIVAYVTKAPTAGNPVINFYKSNSVVA